MKQFKGRLTLTRNSRGCYILDTVKGCAIMAKKPRGCYDDCYAFNIASRYGVDFGTPVKREFTRETRQPSLFGFSDTDHVSEIVKEIRKIKMPFVRIGEMGDPSEDWEHTLSVCREIELAGKPVVIITKHWKTITEELLPRLRRLCINTSVSALDTPEEIAYRLEQYERLKPYCQSVLRIVSCKFNPKDEEGRERAKVQESLFRNELVLDTVFRPSPKNPFFLRGVVLAEKTTFLKSKVLASVHNLDAYFGPCQSCHQMCGINL